MVWENQRGGLTFEIGAGAATDRLFVKWNPPASGIDLGAEVVRLRWARPFLAVPEVLDHGTDEDGEWMVTAALPGRNAVDDLWLRRPADAVTAIGRGLRALHDALPVDGCPFSWAAEDRVLDIPRRVEPGAVVDTWNPARLGLDRADALASAAAAPSVDRLVVCHGDACAPNTLLAEDGTCTGHVDLGTLGIADRWADLAVASWSCDWNYGSGWQPTLLEAYGVDPDPARTRYYRVLWDLDP